MPVAPCIVALSMLAGQAPAAPPLEALLGRTVTDVRVEIAGEPTAEAGVIELLETRLGEPLSMADIRDTIDHLVGIGRFDDVRASASLTPGGGGVTVTWTLRPVQRIHDVEFHGASSVPAKALETLLKDRFGAQPSTARLTDIAAAVGAYYRDRGFRSATATPRLVPAATPGAMTLQLQIVEGPRAIVASARVDGSPPTAPADVLQRLGVQVGRAYDRSTLEARIATYEESLRGDGYYEASVRESTVLAEDGNSAAVAIDVQPGPRVRIVFAGDPLPENERNTLVPIREERSIDEDLLEDASRSIERYLRERGYRAAEAPYTRSESKGELVLTFTVRRGPLHHVGAVHVSGVTALSPTDLEPLLKLTPGDPFVDARVATIASAIVELYHVRGFQQADVKPIIEVLPQESRGGPAFRPVNVDFAVGEGPQTLVGSVTIEGATARTDAQARRLLALTEGKPFYRPQMTADRDALERAYRNSGFLQFAVTPRLTPSAQTGRVDIAWDIREGPQTLVDHILVTGNVRTSAAVIRRELTLAPGKPLGAEALVESQLKLSELGLFRRVHIAELPRASSADRDVLVEVEESPATSISYGGGVEVGRRLRQSPDGTVAEERLEVAPRIFFEISRRNLWGKNRTLSFFSRVALRPRDPAKDNTDPTDTGGYGLNEYRVLGTFREPRAFGTTGDAQVTAFVEQGVRASFNFNRRGVRTEFAKRFRSSLTATGRYTNDYTRLFDEQIAPEDQLLIDRLFPQVHLSTFSGGILRDSRDDVLEPKKGTVVGVDSSIAARAIGSEVGFAKTFLQGFVYRRLPGRGFVAAAGARTGLAMGFPREVPQLDSNGATVIGADGRPGVDVVKDLPASERFFAGGDTTVRGFALDRLGTDETLDEQGFPQGGNGLVVLNSELRSPYWKGLGFVGFVDAGNVFRLTSDIDLGRLRVATGFGVRYRSPIGPLRIDLGFKVHPRTLASGARERGAIVHISLGQAF